MYGLKEKQNNFDKTSYCSHRLYFPHMCKKARSVAYLDQM